MIGDLEHRLLKYVKHALEKMRYTELSILNHVMLMRPEHVMHGALCPREEVAKPSKILRRHTWCDFNDMFKSALVGSPESSCFLLAPESSLNMWSTIFDIPVSSASIGAWLDENRSKNFIVTYPIINQSYSYTHRYPYIVRLSEGRIQTLLVHKSYTICNGLTLALAMHRLGAWPGRVMKQALRAMQHELHVYDPIDMCWMPYYADHILQICDFPAHYALCGGADLGVIAFLIGDRLSQLQQHIQGGRIKYTTYAATAFSSGVMNWELYKMLTRGVSWPARSQLHTHGDTSEPDWAGFARACVGSRGFWRAWQQNASFRTNVLVKLNGCSSSQKSVLNLVFPALFVLHEQGFHRARVRGLWKACIVFFGCETCVPWLRAYITRHLVTELMSEQFPEDVMRHTMPPVAFMKDVFGRGFRYHEVHEYRFYVRAMTDARAKHLLKCNLPITCVDNENAYAVTISLHGTLKRLANQNARTYLNYYVERPALLRLCCMKRIFWGPSAPVDGHIIGDIMREHFKTRREELFE